MGTDHLEQAPDEAAGRPVRHRDATARAQHAQHLAGGAVVVGREHDAERGQHDVEAGIGEGQCLCIGELEVHRQPFGLGARAAFLEQALHVIGRGHLRMAAGCGERGVAVAGGDVEHGLAGTHVCGLGKRLADDLQCGPDDGVIATRPGGLLALLDGGEVRGGLFDDGVHGKGLCVGGGLGICAGWRRRIHSESPTPLTLHPLSGRFARASTFDAARAWDLTGRPLRLIETPSTPVLK